MTDETRARGTAFWYTRPVFFTADAARAERFYREVLGFAKDWHQGTVLQVSRGDSEIILCQEDREDRGRLFIELDVAGIAELRREIDEHAIPHRMSWWGYDCIQIDDPDGNELLFPLGQ
jgi:catechol 2,3-dioxygenase-like lactoylglutathione lyase family enzyme